MNGIGDGIIDRWANEAVEDLGEKGWRDIDPNSMLLIIYALQRDREKRQMSKITKPIWWLLGVMGAGFAWYMITGLFGVA